MMSAVALIVAQFAKDIFIYIISFSEVVISQHKANLCKSLS